MRSGPASPATCTTASGQWLSYISFELERIITTNDAGSPELDQLYGDVQKAIDELRETLRQLRSGVTAERPLSQVAEELIERFNRRGTRWPPST